VPTKKTATANKSSKPAEAKKPAVKKASSKAKGAAKAQAAESPAATKDDAAEAPAAEGGAKRKTKKAKTPKASDGRLSQLDAAVKVLGEADVPMSTKDMVETMGQKGYWSSPGGRTPEATLYSAILREVKNKGDEARFVKTERGRFALKADRRTREPHAAESLVDYTK
jgi:hypothetical protein